MVLCEKCGSDKNVIKSGFIRGQQRLYCKACEVHFTMNLPQKGVNKPIRQVTIVDIAKALGVAPSTVSRALNGSSDINPQTRLEILRVATEMDYRPNLLAQSLHRGETHTIGVVIPDIERPFFAAVLAGIQKVATGAGYRVMICQSNESHSTETLNVQALVASRVDGLLISHSKETTSFEHIKLQLKKGLPIVHFDRVCYDIETSKVVQEDFDGSFALVEHLILQGCRRIAVCAGPRELLISTTRLNGYKAALAKYGIPLDEELIYHSNFKKGEPVLALKAWLELDQKPDGIFAVHYANAVDMIMELKRLRIQIPEQIAVVGFGDELIASLIEPSLTVFHLFPFNVGETAATLLIDNIIHKDTFEPVVKKVKGELIIRESSLRTTSL
ncbi:LacI family DNA-binding transcriptional regulator [Runella aurantiaca]|uniref:LacI family DNA-binding transcriptional regulator n=2 Tax=Runella aurantiaca TaxID=2282308 RepID=A0A369ICJ8_9BACT|nr:LacI family DNA-binding transcriptional regulator [Runella aurantiaca]